MSLEPVSHSPGHQRHVGDVESLLWHDGHVISSGDGGKVKIWTPELKLLDEFQAHDHPIYHMASEGHNFYTCSNDCTIKEWSQVDGKWTLIGQLVGHKSPVRRLRIDSGRVYSGDEGGDIFIWKDGKLERKFNNFEEIWDMFVEGEKIYTVRDRDVVISNMSQRGNLSYFNTLQGRGPLRVSGDKLVFVDRNGMDIHVHDNVIKGNPLLGKLQGHSRIINSIIGDPDKFFTAGWDNKVVAWDLNTLSKITEEAVDGYVNTMAISPLGFLYVAGANGTITGLQINI